MHADNLEAEDKAHQSDSEEDLLENLINKSPQPEKSDTSEFYHTAEAASPEKSDTSEFYNTEEASPEKSDPTSHSLSDIEGGETSGDEKSDVVASEDKSSHVKFASEDQESVSNQTQAISDQTHTPENQPETGPLQTTTSEKRLGPASPEIKEVRDTVDNNISQTEEEEQSSTTFTKLLSATLGVANKFLQQNRSDTESGTLQNPSSQEEVAPPLSNTQNNSSRAQKLQLEADDEDQKEAGEMKSDQGSKSSPKEDSPVLVERPSGFGKDDGTIQKASDSPNAERGESIKKEADSSSPQKVCRLRLNLKEHVILQCLTALNLQDLESWICSVAPEIWPHWICLCRSVWLLMDHIWDILLRTALFLGSVRCARSS